MTYFLVLYIGLVCPPVLGRFLPAAVKPLVCETRPEAGFFDRADRAVARVRALGPGARLQRCRGFRCKDLTLDWRTELEVKGLPD